MQHTARIRSTLNANSLLASTSKLTTISYFNLPRSYSTSSPTPIAATTASTSTSFPEPTARRYARPVPISRDLPELQSRTPLYLTIFIASAISWGSFLYYATHNERANSSVVRSLTFQLRNSNAVEEFLGKNVALKPIFGEFRKVDGSINMLAGKIDVQFRVTGSDAKGTASFTSVRRGKEGKFEVLRWRITRDDGEILDLSTKDPRRVRGDGEGLSS